MKKGLESFVKAFEERLGRTPDEYISEKLQAGSQVDDVKYLFNIIACEISQRIGCKFYDFDYFNVKTSSPVSERKRVRQSKRSKPENAGKFWTKEEELLLVEMYTGNATKKQICETFKRTEAGIAARLVRLGVITERDVFRSRK